MSLCTDLCKSHTFPKQRCIGLYKCYYFKFSISKVELPFLKVSLGRWRILQEELELKEAGKNLKRLCGAEQRLRPLTNGRSFEYSIW